MSLKKTFKAGYEPDYYKSVTLSYTTGAKTIKVFATDLNDEPTPTIAIPALELEEWVKGDRRSCYKDHYSYWSLKRKGDEDSFICFTGEGVKGPKCGHGYCIKIVELEAFLKECQKPIKKQDKKLLEQYELERLWDIVE